MEMGKVPKRLYRYRRFSTRTLDMLVKDKFHYANPTTFNDPLDTRPSLFLNLDNNRLEEVLSELVIRRVRSEQQLAVLMRGEGIVKLRDRIEHESRQQAEDLIRDVNYDASEPGYEFEALKRSILHSLIEAELHRRYEKGVVCLAGSANSTLMWSHYGDEHRGICIGYSVPADTVNLHKVVYGGSREVKASKVAAMLEEDETARREVDEAVLLRKAASWRYEREWRLIGLRGLHDSPLELEEIIFGMRCENSTKFVMVKILEQRKRAVKFYEIRESRTFKLKKYALDTEELLQYFPRRSLSTFEDFEC